VRVDSVALILCGGCPPGELREGSGEITRTFFRIDGFEKMSVFREHFMRFGIWIIAETGKQPSSDRKDRIPTAALTPPIAPAE